MIAGYDKLNNVHDNPQLLPPDKFDVSVSDRPNPPRIPRLSSWWLVQIIFSVIYGLVPAAFSSQFIFLSTFYTRKKVHKTKLELPRVNTSYSVCIL